MEARQTGEFLGGQRDKLTGKQAFGQENGWTDAQTDRPTDTQTDI